MDKDQQGKLAGILGYALNMERNGKAFFENALHRVENPNAVTALARLVEEEEGHVVLIQQAMELLGMGETRGYTALVGKALKPVRYFDRNAQKDFLRQIRETPTLPDLSVFQTAWLIEREICRFYERAAGRAAGQIRALLMRLYDFERKHEIFFRRYYDELTAVYAAVYQERPWA